MELVETEDFTVEWCIRGHHVYKDMWGAGIGEELLCEREVGNIADVCAVAVIKNGETVGHIPRKISRISSIFIRRGGRISCQVTGSRQYSGDLPQGGLEVPCTIKFQGPGKEVKKIIKLVTLQMPQKDIHKDKELTKTKNIE